MAQSVSVIERDGLRLHVFLSRPTIFQVTSVVLEAEDEVALIDAQFSADNAAALTELIRATGKPLRTIFISHSDPDFYFGLETVAAAFPEAKILSTPQTAWTIGATRDDKLAIWAPQLGSNAPKKTIRPVPLAADHFMVGPHRVEIVSNMGDGSHSWLWIASASTIMGGIRVQDNQHLWVADTPAARDRAGWLASLETMRKMRPQLVIPAHFTPPHDSKLGLGGLRAVEFTHGYLTALEGVLAETTTADQVIARMSALYPGLPGVPSLETSAKVLKGEMAWKTTTAFPPIGRKAEVDFGGEYLFELDFTVPGEMTFRGLKPRADGRLLTDTVKYTAVQVAPLVYMVYWTEKDNTHVVHVEDFGAGVAYTNIASPDGSFTNLGGTLRLPD